MNETYRAAVCTALTGPSSIVVKSLPRKKLASDEVRIKVHAAGVNYPDLLMTSGGYQLKLDPPFVPGMEVAGEVIEVGRHVDDWKPGQSVIAATRSGGFAEEVTVSANSAIPKPAILSLEQGACFIVAARTAYHALVERGGLTSDDTLLVLGATGGVGLAAVQMAHAIGARIFGVGSSDEKLSVAKEKGADHVLNYTVCDLIDQVTALSPEGVSVVFDPVGGELAVAARRLMSWGGRYLIVGFASGDVPLFPANHAILKGYSLIGVRAGEAARRDPASLRASLENLLQLASQGAMTPHIYQRFSLSETGAALKTLADRGVTDRIALIMDRDER
ncbi:NADPH:quinone oxidoreductase family protein [Roseibium sp.]|uniref:NADPH:quinone oxidoreductase family protein n=1 Tax=Roseibium sp. TaxID=1936156 RepID=UPI003296F919